MTMTEEEDKNANIVRDKDGNAIAVESMYGKKKSQMLMYL